MLITFFMISCSFHYDNYIFLLFLFFISALIPSMDKGKYGFSGRKPRPTSFSSWPGVSPPASSASPDTISAPEKLRRTFQRGKIRAGEEEDDGGVAWHLPPGLPRPVPLGRGWRPPRTMTMSSADFLPLESVFAPVHRGSICDIIPFARGKVYRFRGFFRQRP